VLTNRRADRSSASRSAVLAGAAIMLSVITVSSARAGNCVGGGRSFNCVAQWGVGGDPYVRIVPEALDEAERTRAAARDHKWQTRCHPVVERDIYGVARYQYSAAGCEFGVGAD
jgi:hypothetical protein